MLDVHVLRTLADKLHFVTEDVEGWTPPNFEGIPLETLLQANAKNGPVLRQCQELLHQITRDDFVFEWDFYQRNEALFKSVAKILRALWMEGLGNARQGNLNEAILNALDSLALTRPLKDVAFLNDYLTLQRFLTLPILGIFQKHRNDFSPELRKLIIKKCLAILNDSLPDVGLLGRSVGYLTGFQREIVGDFKKAEKEELRNCLPTESEEIQNHYAMCVKSASEPYTQKHLEKMEWSLKKLRAEVLMTLLDLGLKNYREVHADYPQGLGHLLPDFMPCQAVDPFGEGDFVYERASSDSYSLYSAGYFGLSDIQKSGGHPLALKVRDDLVVIG
jgi:hypothetical protein